MIDLPESWRVESNGKRLNLKSFTPATLNTTIKTAIERIKTEFLPGPDLDSCETVKP